MAWQDQYTLLERYLRSDTHSWYEWRKMEASENPTTVKYNFKPKVRRYCNRIRREKALTKYNPRSKLSAPMAEVTYPKQFSKAPKGAAHTVAFNSSFLQSATYDPASFSLEVAFKSGKTIVYKNVFQDVWDDWQEAQSKGSHYAREIKGKHESTSLKNPLFPSDFDKAFAEARGY